MKMERCNAGSCDHLFVFDPSVVVIDVKHRITTCELTYLVRVIISLYLTQPRAGSGVVRMDPLRFLAGCRTRRLNQA